MNSIDLDRDELLTVKEAADRSGSSIPRFYSERNKEILGFYEAKEGTWFISVGRLIDAGFLKPDGSPASPARPRGAGKKEKKAPLPEGTQEELEELRHARDQAEAELARAKAELVAQTKENERLSIILTERDKQLENSKGQFELMVNAFAQTRKQ